MTTHFEKIQEMSFDAHNTRQYNEITEQVLSTRALDIKGSNKFIYQNGNWSKMPYQGYAIISMVNKNKGNKKLIEQLTDIQKQLISNLQKHYQLYALPTESLHQTIANTLSAEKFKKHILENGLASHYPQILHKAFDLVDVSNVEKPIEIEFIGLGIFGTALGLLGVLPLASDYKRIIDFREAIYTNGELNAIGIKRTRPFVAHITLAYFDGTFEEKESRHLKEICVSLNQKIVKKQLKFLVSIAELRSYEDLSSFSFLPHYPSYSFVKI